MKLEEIFPEIRKGRKFRRKAWQPESFFFIKYNKEYDCQSVYDEECLIENYGSLDLDWLEHDDWELVPEPKKYSAKAHLWSDGRLTGDFEQIFVPGKSKKPYVIETRTIEWEVTE